MVIDKRPKLNNVYNLKYYFNVNSVSPRAIQPGNIIEFSYRSPEGVHDKKPLVYVLDVQGDRVYGINIHYKFAPLIMPIIEEKKKEVIKYIPVQKAPIKKDIEDVQTVNQEQQNIDLSKVKIPPIVLETFILTEQPVAFLRNYLYTRISNLKKFIYKPV